MQCLRMRQPHHRGGAPDAARVGVPGPSGLREGRGAAAHGAGFLVSEAAIDGGGGDMNARMTQAVNEFASQMIQRLAVEEPEKGDWAPRSISFLETRLVEEVGKLMRADHDAHVSQIKRRAINVANFAMMIADNSGGLTP